jgi:F0F1-type ATP synthase membrane subunit c/vacuolar-type H+-ATPase subunit K
MLNPEDKEKIQNVIRTHWFIWLAFATAVILYMVVVFIVVGGRESEPKQFGMLRQVFIILSVVLGAVKFWVQSRVMFQEASYAKCRSLDEIIGKYASRFFIILALCEAPAIFGLVIVFLTMRMEEWWLFFIISMVLYATSTPRADKLETIAEAHATRVS